MAHYVSETQALRRVLATPGWRFRWTQHAPDRMRERGVTTPDIEKVLRRGQVVLVERKTDDVWRVEGRDIDGDPLAVEAVVYEDECAIKIITVF